jgi:hypothetical protein
MGEIVPNTALRPVRRAQESSDPDFVLFWMS